MFEPPDSDEEREAAAYHRASATAGPIPGPAGPAVSSSSSSSSSSALPMEHPNIDSDDERAAAAYHADPAGSGGSPAPPAPAAPAPGPAPALSSSSLADEFERGHLRGPGAAGARRGIAPQVSDAVVSEAVVSGAGASAGAASKTDAAGAAAGRRPLNLVIGARASPARASDAASPAPVSLEDQMRGRACDECRSISIDQATFSTFGETICVQCKMNNPAFKCLTKTKAKDAFLLSDDDMYGLKYLHQANPRRMGWSSMKLYLSKQVQRVAMEKWGSADAVEVERKRREKERVRNREKRAKKAMADASADADDSDGEGLGGGAMRRNIKRLREELDPAGAQEEERLEATKTKTKGKKKKKKKKKAGNKGEEREFVPRNEEYHDHVFGKAKPRKGAVGVFVKRCSECGFKVKFEQL